MRALTITALSCLCMVAAEPPSMRLGNSVTPAHYAVELRLSPGGDTFSGKVDIDVNVHEQKDVVCLNAAGLNITEARVGEQPAKVVPGGKEMIGLDIGTPVPQGPAKLHLDYTGRISKNSSAGLFALQEDKRWYVYSQFEPTDARRAFPCFDEPAFKAPWDVSLRVPRELMAVANTPQVSESDGGNGMKLVRFATTRPLPSYLVAIGVGPFEAVNLGKVGRKHVPMRIIVPHGKTGQAEFASHSIPQLLTRLEDYFGTPYPYEKLDSLVMPISNFAMENAGLITYGQSLLLSTPANDTINRRRLCAMVTAHEMAHQWFGDLVTTGWWEDIWLNEAFATWMEGKIVAEWKPEWDIPASEIDDRLGAMNLDSLVSSRKIRQPITSDNDIANAFDGITYQKGAAVIRMFEHWIGAEKFRRGVQIYLKQNADKSATSAIFLAAISKGAGHDVAPAFSTFLDQAGVPVILAELKCDGKPRLALEQKRYLPIGSPGAPNQMWQIPVCVKYEADGRVHSECDMMTDPRSSMVLTQAKSCPAWVMGNDGGNGYYRVAYKDGMLARLLDGGAQHLSVPEKLSLLGEMKPLVDSGDVPAREALQIAVQFANSPEHEIVDRTIAISELVFSPAVPESLLPNARRFVRDVYGPRALKLGWKSSPGEGDKERLLRQTLTPFVARYGHEQPLIDEAGRLARAWLTDRSAIQPGLVGPVLRTAAEFGDRSLFDALLNAVSAEKDPRSRREMFAALGSFRDPKLAWAGMELLLTGRFDAREAFFALLFGPLQNRETEKLPFQFVRENLPALLSKLPREVGGDFTGALPGVGAPVCDPTGRAELEAFFKDRVKDFTGGPRRFAQVLETTRVCIALKPAIVPSVTEFLRKYPVD
jgi:cytosol alanyl aminopeptidase